MCLIIDSHIKNISSIGTPSPMEYLTKAHLPCTLIRYTSPVSLFLTSFTNFPLIWRPRPPPCYEGCTCRWAWSPQSDIGRGACNHWVLFSKDPSSLFRDSLIMQCNQTRHCNQNMVVRDISNDKVCAEARYHSQSRAAMLVSCYICDIY